MPHAHILESGSHYMNHSAESYSACILGLGNALGLRPQSFHGSQVRPRIPFCRVSYLLHGLLAIQGRCLEDAS